MPRYSEQFIYQVQQATDIVDLISQYVSLKQRGREFIGLCPFHDDKNPSMNVSPTKQIFKCFACGAGGAVFNFLMLYESVTFPEAVRTLAERAHIPLPQQGAASQEPAGLSKADLTAATALAMDFFRRQLHAPAGAAALAYAHDRGLSDESIERFAIGYAPDSWEGLVGAAGRAGISQTRLVTAGLAGRRESSDGCFDRFRNRLMFPIFDPSGQVIAFGGRALAPEERAKYLNSPENPLFDKSSQLYALNWSREGIRASGRAVVVEGYLDALIPLQAGVNNVVATLGTALTDRHVRILSRQAREVVLVFDADAAGAQAAERALEMFLAQQMSVRVATIPAGKDPCDYCLAEGPEALTRLVDQAPDALEYAWARRQEQLAAAGANLADRRRVIEDFLRLVAACSNYGAIDEIRRGQIAGHIGHMLNIPLLDIQRLMQRLGRRARAERTAGRQPEDLGQWLSVLGERQVLEVLLNSPELFDSAAERIDPDDFADEDLRAVAQCVWKLGAEGNCGLENLLSNESMAPHGALLADLATAGEQRGNFHQTLQGAVEDMLRRRNSSELQELKSRGYDGDATLRQIQQRLGSDLRRRPQVR